LEEKHFQEKWRLGGNDLLKIDDFFDAGGLLDTSISDFEYREGQMEMAKQVNQAYEEDAIAVIEAGTGIGKSFAYLVPALMKIEKDSEDKTVIATATKNLQKQLFEKDIPQLFKALGKTWKVAILYGRQNYICKRKIEEKMALLPLLINDDSNELSLLYKYSLHSSNGLFNDFSGFVSNELRQETCSDSETCLSYKCPYLSSCFYYHAKQLAREASLLITNHHLVFTDCAYRNQNGIDFTKDAILPPYSRLILDEAHNIEQNATDLFTFVFSSYELTRQLTKLVKKHSMNRNLLELLVPFSSKGELIDTIVELQSYLKIESATLNDYLTSFFASRNTTSFRIKNPQDMVYDKFFPLITKIGKYIDQLSLNVGLFIKSLDDDKEGPYSIDELQIISSRLANLALAINKFADRNNWTKDVYFIEKRYIKGNDVFELKIAPLSIAEMMQSYVYSSLRTVICTSATLDLKDDFKYWGSRVGLPCPNKKIFTLKIDSSFNYKENLLLITALDSPEFDDKSPEKYVSYIKEMVFSAIISSNGGTLVLFTSYKMMKEVYNALSDKLRDNNIPPLIQGSMDRFRVLNLFKEDENSTLFATSSFWQGIDAPGNTLRLVIIVKLPFPSPGEPILGARLQELDSRGESGFARMLLPEAIMRLKQGYGRLIRKNTDKGIVLILDSRVVKKSYGGYMLSVLPDSYQLNTESKNVCDKIENFLY